METTEKNKTVWVILAMNFIPLIIATLTLIMILYFEIYAFKNISFEGVFIFFLLMLLPIFGIITYILCYIDRQKYENLIAWEMGCVNSAIWAIVFLCIFIAQLFSTQIDSIFYLLCTIYFGVLLYLNQQVCDFRKNQLNLSNNTF
jgi:DNA-binding XRE family transcriptional regulator